MAGYIGSKANVSQIDGYVKSEVDTLLGQELNLSGGSMTGHLNFGDNIKIQSGAGTDLQIYHDASHSYIKDAGTGNLRLSATAIELMKVDTSELMASFAQDGAVTLYYDNAAKLATASGGITVTGEVAATSLDISGDIDVDGTTNLDVVDIDGAVDFASTTAHAGNATFADNAKAIFGSGDDLQIFHEGNNSFVKDAGTGSLYLQADAGVYITNAAGSENKAIFTSDGAVTLYHDNAAKLATTSTGIDVTGKVTSTGLIGNATNFDIMQNTSDGSDNKRTRIGGGGDVTSSRGALVEVSGNEHGNGGGLFLQAGHGGNNSVIRSYTSNVERSRIASNGDISFYDTSENAKFFWDASVESLGIGTSSPSEKLHVQGDGADILLTDAGGGQTAKLGATGSNNGILELNNSSHTSTVVLNTSGDSYLNGGNIGIGTSSPSDKLVVKGDAATISVESADMNIVLLGKRSSSGVGLDQGYLRLRNQGVTANGAVIDSAGNSFFNGGNVGIGTSSPTSILDVRDGTDANIQSKLINTGQTTAGREAEFLFGKDNGANLSAVLKYYYHTTQADRRIDLFHYGTTNGLSILNGGNVGIGDSAPSEKLNVAGNIMLEGGDQYIYLTNVGTGNSGIYVRGNTAGSYLRSHSTGKFTWETAGTERMELSSSGQLKATAGAVSAPTYSFVGDTDTGISRPTTNAVNIVTGGTERARIDGSGLLSITNNNNSHNFKANAGSSNSWFGVYDDANNSANIEIRRSDAAQVFYVIGHTGNYHFAGSDTSDRDLKENITNVPDGSLGLVKQLKPRIFNFKESEGFDTASRTGFIAQEVESVFSTANHVATGTDGQKDMGVDTVGLVAHLTKALQEQQEVIESLTARITALEA